MKPDKDQLKKDETDWDNVPWFKGPGSWESTQEVSESWKKARAENKQVVGRTNSFGD